jgi:site-specific recombinase XerD
MIGHGRRRSRKFFKENSTPHSHSKTMSFFSSSATPTFVMGAIDAESSSSSDEETYTLREGLDSFFEKLATTTTIAYKQRINDFIQWYGKEYGRMIDRRLKKKHLKRYFVHKKNTGTRQMRIVVVSIKSMCRHLFKLKMLKKDITIGIPDPRQLPAKNERKMTPDTVKAFFALTNTKKDPSSWCMIALLTYAGLRIKVLSRLKVADIKKDEVQNDGAIVESYKVHVRDGKGGKNRYCGLKKEVGEKLYAYAQSLNTTYLFPGRKENQPMHSQSISGRIKRMAKHESIGRPEISAHYFRQ